MNDFDPGKPLLDEYQGNFATYVDRVPMGSIIPILRAQRDSTRALLASLTAEQAAFRPKPDDWNIVQVVGHIADTERVFSYRTLRFARNDPTPLPGFDQDLFVANADFEARGLASVLANYEAVRAATIALLSGLPEAAWLRRGVASNSTMSVRALAYAIAGHELHHVSDFRERYNLAAK